MSSARHRAAIARRWRIGVLAAVSAVSVSVVAPSAVASGPQHAATGRHGASAASVIDPLTSGKHVIAQKQREAEAAEAAKKGAYAALKVDAALARQQAATSRGRPKAAGKGAIAFAGVSGVPKKLPAAKRPDASKWAAAPKTPAAHAATALAYGPGPAVPGMDPGGMPDYFGTIGNYANSPLPQVDPSTGGITAGTGIRKFVDSLPGLGSGAANDLGQYIPVAQRDITTFPGTDYYEIAVVQYKEQLHKDLPATLLRGYVQLETNVVKAADGIGYPLCNELQDGTCQPVLNKDGTQVMAVDKPHYLGPWISSTAGRAVRVTFRNLLPTGSGGDLFLPVDTSEMGAGMGPDAAAMTGMSYKDCQASPKPADCYTENRATIHLHGGLTPWISDGTPHQWITPAGENTMYPKGVSVQYVPDMWYDQYGNVVPAGTPGASNNPGDGSQTFYYTNQQSARLMFFHDHSYGITRLNVYAGEAAGYTITDDAEKQLIKDGVIPDAPDTLPLVIEDKTFVPNQTQLAATDPTWNGAKWGGVSTDPNGSGQLWFPHVYMPNQNPTNDSGANATGRWDYGPWFWPPFTGLKNGPVANPRFDPSCDPSSTTCEGAQNPGVPDVSMTMESFFDTPLVNGTAYPYVNVDRKVYRLRILNASNDRPLNLQLYYAKSNGQMWNVDGTLNDANAGEVPIIDATKAAETTAGCTSTQMTTWPTDGRDSGVPDCKAANGLGFVQIANEGGFLPAPYQVPNQPVNYIYDRRNIKVLDIASNGLLIAPAERADVLIDLTNVPAGSNLILYNDAPAANPAVDPRNDYYTGDPDHTDTGGAPSTQPGYGPNTRTLLQFRVKADASVGTPLDVTKLTDGLKAAYQTDQPAPIVPQKAYNGLTMKNYDGSTVTINTTTNNYVRLQDTQTTFTPAGASAPVAVGMKPKAIVEEFDPTWGRMSATLGAEMPNTNANVQTTVPFGYAEPVTEILDPSQVGTKVGDLGDGTQIWKITHNGVDTHPVHFHLFDVQLVNRVAWDGAISGPEPNELGWKDTVRMHPLEDTIVALRPKAPVLPFKLPDASGSSTRRCRRDRRSARSTR